MRISSKRKGRVALTALALAAMIAMPATAHAQISRGELMATSCFACHGTDGYSSGDMPTIDGMSKADIIKAMNGYRSGLVASTLMDRHAKGYTDEEIAEMAQYLSTIGKKH
jgi:cytochrome subunit of sulfide dehydrogenase